MERSDTQPRPGRPRRLAAAAACLAAGAALLPAAGQTPKGIIHKLPVSGRTYEVLFPPGKAEDFLKLPVVLYLHASATPQPDRAKRDYWPILAKRKCLMALPKSRSEKMWVAGEESYVADVLADVQTRYSVDAGRVILLGVSGGGQVALFLADRLPEKFRAIIVVSVSPVVIRVTQGSALMYWRQVRAKLAGAGASLSILPVTGPAEQYLPPPKELAGWLDQVLAGKHPKPLPDPQKLAVAKMFAKCVAALPKAIQAAGAAPAGESITKDGQTFRLAVRPPADFRRSASEDQTDSSGGPLTQIRVEHAKWPVYVRCEVRATEQPMAKVLAAEEAQNAQRGVLYQVYRTGQVAAGGRSWRLKLGSTTYPDRRRGWVSVLFLHAAAPIRHDPKQWLTVVVLDETQQPDAKQLATVLKTALATVTAQPAPSE